MKAVLLDIGGVIIRTDDPAPRERLARRFGMDREGLDHLVFQSAAADAAERGEASEEAVWGAVQKALNLPAVEMDDFQKEFWGGDIADASLFDLLTGLRARFGCRVGLLTNNWRRDPLEMFWQRFGLPENMVRSAVDVVISSATLGVKKPDPRIYAAALQRLGAQAAETVFIDDFETNIAAARQLGFETILFESPTQTRRDLLALLER